MTLYSYKARDPNGLLVTGQMEGIAIEPIKIKLADQGLIPISVSKGGAGLNKQTSLNFFNRVNTQELMLFSKQFATLFKAGMDMDTLLNTMAKQTKNKFFAEAILRIKTDVASGSSLSRAFSQHPKIFDELYINMLATGEEAGILDESLNQLCDVLEKEMRLKASVKSATLYPKIVMFVLTMACTVMLTVVIPKFASFYDNYNAQLPLPTRILMTSSDIVRNYWYICILVGGAMIFAFKKWRQTSKGKLLTDRFFWTIPVFGPLGQKVANARFANILGSLYRSGIPLTRGLEITAKTMGHEGFKQEIAIVKADVEKGKSISQAMRSRAYFSPLLIESTAIGEKSGSLDEMYVSIGAHFDSEVQHTLKTLTTLLEPFLLFFVFGMVAVFALAIFLPMWNMSTIVN